MLKREELADPGSCLSRARDDERVFVLLARDAAAPAAIRAWVAERLRLGKNARGDGQIAEAEECAAAMGRESAPRLDPPVALDLYAALAACLPHLRDLRAYADARYATDRAEEARQIRELVGRAERAVARAEGRP